MTRNVVLKFTIAGREAQSKPAQTDKELMYDDSARIVPALDGCTACFLYTFSNFIHIFITKQWPRALNGVGSATAYRFVSRCILFIFRKMSRAGWISRLFQNKNTIWPNDDLVQRTLSSAVVVGKTMSITCLRCMYYLYWTTSLKSGESLPPPAQLYHYWR